MATPQEKAQCVSWYIEIRVRNSRTKYGGDPPSLPSICAWRKHFMETGTVLDGNRSGQPRTSEENVDRVREAFSRSPTMSAHTVTRQLELPGSAVHKRRITDCSHR